MNNNVLSVNDLVIQALTNGSGIKAKAETGDALACFQMGMIHLLGIDTPIDFEKASKFFGNPSLNDDPDANRLLGFIAECEGNYSQAFKNYANAGKANRPYFNKVSEERINLQGYFKKLSLPTTVQNKIITNVLNEYIKGGDTKVEASIRIAMICEDETSCLNAAQALFDNGDYHSAMSWLQNGNISESNTLYASVKKKISDSKNAQNLPNVLDVIEIEGNSFLANIDASPSYAGIRHLCDEQSAKCKKEWIDTISPKIAAVIQKEKDEEAVRIKKQKDEEAARSKKQKEEEEAARMKKQRAEEEARKKKQQEIDIQEQIKRKEKINHKFNKYFLIFFSPVFLFMLAYLIGAKEVGIASRLAGCVIILIAFVFFPYIIIKWIVKKINKL